MTKNCSKYCVTVKIIKRRFLLQFRDLLPSTSPIDNNYKPTKFKCFDKTNSILQKYHHRWRCTGTFQYFCQFLESYSWKVAIAIAFLDRDREKLNSEKVFLQRLSPNRKKLLHDKLECATLFSSKASYPSTIPHIYKNDYLGMHAEAKWLDIRNKNQFSPSQVFIGQ